MEPVFTVKFVDFGAERELGTDPIYRIPESLKFIPFQAVHCRAKVAGAGQEPETLRGKKIRAVFRRSKASGPPHVLDFRAGSAVSVNLVDF